MKKDRVFSKYAQNAALLLGQQIKLARKTRKWSEKNLADRAGISRATLQKIEAGAMTPSIGLAFEVATLVGLPLFTENNTQLTMSIDYTQNKIALLPKRIDNKAKVVDDDF